MNDDDQRLLGLLRNPFTLNIATEAEAADRIEALVAEVASLRANEAVYAKDGEA